MFRKGDMFGHPNFLFGLVVFVPVFAVFRLFTDSSDSFFMLVMNFTDNFYLIFFLVSIPFLVFSYFENKYIWSRWITMSGPYDFMNISFGFGLGILSRFYVG
ncbi:hypothetical protein [Oceanicoccus sagamiensis]|uniref:Uncharacterized protein n=1 Tax=Oceanicoccus sagamiensis TaxID=716816 RepID=A0A1X9N8W3_9GAMM|nr:hypothetical protein [Oceanicoccus sagamiensis]ARN73524.1 hypothetical protein BST96_04955 [Oceanicoccus sagamiensis]